MGEDVPLWARGNHTMLRFVTTCNNGVFNGGIFIHFSINFCFLFVDKKLFWRIFKHPIFICNYLERLILALFLLKNKNHTRTKLWTKYYSIVKPFNMWATNIPYHLVSINNTNPKPFKVSFETQPIALRY